MNVRRFTFAALLALAGIGSFVTLRAGGQQPANNVETRFETEEIVQQLPDGRVERVIVQVPVAEPRPAPARPQTIVEQREDGVVVERTVDGEVLRMQKGPPGFSSGSTVAVSDGRSLSVVQYAPPELDAESQKLLVAERAAAEEARTLLATVLKAESPADKEKAKKNVRVSLAQVFDLQQQRRTREIAKIEERLGKLKDVLKKRETAKDSIIDRRLESLTGGVDELGWEESFSPSSAPAGGSPYSYPPVQPRAANPGFSGVYEAPGPVPAGVVPTGDLPLTIPGPGAVIPPAAVPTPPVPTAAPPAAAPSTPSASRR
jgi:hypothetical protein